MDTDLDARKRQLRLLVRERLRAASPRAAQASEQAQRRLLASGLLDRAQTVASYSALPSEVATAAMHLALRERGCTVCLPVVVEGHRALAFRRDGGPTRRSPLGIEEPLEGGPGTEVALERIDLVVVPGLAADPQGHRLGRGRGHYDATLAALPRALRVMLLFDSGLVPEVPVGEHDARLDAICTESRLLLCTPRAREAARPGAEVVDPR